MLRKACIPELILSSKDSSVSDITFFLVATYANLLVEREGTSKRTDSNKSFVQEAQMFAAATQTGPWHSNWSAACPTHTA